MQTDIIMQLQNLFKFYHLGNEIIKAFRNINLQAYMSEYVTIMMASGSGNSTMMNILSCLDTPTNGQYFLNGKDVNKINETELAEIRNKEVGFVFQTFNQMPLYTALGDVALSLVYVGVNIVERLNRAKEMLEKVCLGDRIKHKSRKRVGGSGSAWLLHTLVNHHSIILADKPTMNFDSKTLVEIMRLFGKYI